MRRALAPAALLVAGGAAAAAGALVTAGDPPAHDAIARFATAWSAGNDRAAASLTNRAAAAARQLAASRRGLDGATVRATVGSVRERDDRARARLTVAWDIPRIGTWRYRTGLEARRHEGRWTLRWRPQVVHPALDRDTRLGTTRVAAPRGRIEDRRGRVLVRPRPVVHVAVEVRRVRDAAATAHRLAALLAVDDTRLTRAIRAAPRRRHIPIITLRRGVAERMDDALRSVPGVSLVESTAPLAPTKAFARALLGTVGPATAEQLKRARGGLAEGQAIGQWGLQAQFEQRLAGTPTSSIVVRDRHTGVPLKTLQRRPGRPPRPLRTTLDLDVQHAAERALGGHDGPAALVAVQPSTGDVLAVANRPLDSSLNRAFTGLYPPGSTFKVISTAALLRGGLDVGETVPCPARTLVDGRTFRNFEGGAHGAVPFSVDFAQSCNTAFVALAPRVGRDELTRTARDFGLGRRLDLALPAAEASVPRPDGPVARAAAMIGQDRILASPLSMAGVAATVAAGRWHAPRLVRGDPRRAGSRLAAGELSALRGLMRSVVTGGTGAALAGLGADVAGKSGTAEYGGGDPPPTHAWFIAYRGDLAVAVLVEGGRSGGEVAAPIVARFLAAAS